MNKPILAAVCICMLAIISSSACGMTILSITHIVEVEGNGVTRTERYLPGSILDQIDTYNSSASQLYTASDSGLFRMLGDAIVDVNSEYYLGKPYGRASSFFSVLFEIDKPYKYVLTGSLTGDSASISLFNRYFNQGSINETGILLPGQYEFIAAVGAAASGLGNGERSTIDIVANLSMIPLPPALYLFASGMLWLIGMARRGGVTYTFYTSGQIR